MKKAAEQLNSPDEKTREQGRQNLENALKNPETRKQAQDALNQMAKDAKTPEDKKGVAEIIIGKHRNGATGTVELEFIGRHTRFQDLRRQGGEESGYGGGEPPRNYG